MPSRIQSPSSINTFKQCPRKYFYQYIAKLPTSTNVHLVRGSLVHEVLEQFFDLELPPEPTFELLGQHLHTLYSTKWRLARPDFERIGIDASKRQFYQIETEHMITNWFKHFQSKMTHVMTSKNLTFTEAFAKLTPIREKEYKDQELFVRGFIDAIFDVDGKIIILDYKTSSKQHISEEYRLQLGIYALLYQRLHGKLPDYVGIDFLKGAEVILPATQDLVTYAQTEIQFIHEQTESKDKADYSKSPGPLCKWSTGQCDFYDTCFGVDKDT
ncbi:MAG: PD-(D/E)XK nuclease family protein [Candidatus Woesearchaeota archaeon]|nr:MAG: PD-(D/E)XK nuclease family protein [Candidatus Woesearchaeota archaeon]